MVDTYTSALTTVRPLAPGETTSHEGGIVAVVDDWTRLRRFLILGAEGSFYTAGRELTIANAGVVRRCLDADDGRTIRDIFEISGAGRAPKNEPALLALAIALRHPNVRTRQKAEQAFNDVVRTGTHLLHIAAYVTALAPSGGKISNRLLRRTFGNWFLSKTAEELAYQAIKYPSRDGWALRDILRLASPKTSDPALNSVLRWITKGEGTPLGDPEPKSNLLLGARDALHMFPERGMAASFVAKYDLPREAIPTELLNDRAVWGALLTAGQYGMPMTALIRNLAKMTAVGLLAPGGEATAFVVKRLGDQEALTRARVHPIQLLAALKTYEQGHGERGSLHWTPVKQIVTALDEAFYLAFKAVEPTGKRLRVSVDVSGSMKSGRVNGMSYLTARDAAAAMALVLLATEPNAEIVGFSDRMVPLALRPSMRLDEVLRVMDNAPYGWTWCSLPISDALESRREFDAFVSLTDSETADALMLTHHLHYLNRYIGTDGRIPQYDANQQVIGSYAPPTETAPEVLRRYRASIGIPARHIVVAMVANDISINDPADPYGLDVAGFDTSTPQIIAEFVAGRL